MPTSRKLMALMKSMPAMSPAAGGAGGFASGHVGPASIIASEPPSGPGPPGLRSSNPQMAAHAHRPIDATPAKRIQRMLFRQNNPLLANLHRHHARLVELLHSHRSEQGIERLVL